MYIRRLDNLKGRLATKLLLPKFILILEKASSGSLAVTFSIPPSLVAQLQCDIQNTELKVFLDMDIEIITVDGVICYVAPLLQYTTQLKQLYTSRSPSNLSLTPNQNTCYNSVLPGLRNRPSPRETWTGSLERETWMM